MNRPGESPLSLNRFVSTLRWDTVLQWRQGIYYAAIFVVALWVLILWQLPRGAVEILMPYIIFMDLSVFGFYFMAGILYLEKGEGVLHALVVTPLGKNEYLFSKAVTLTGMAVLVSVGVVLIAWGTQVNWLLFVAGVAFNSWVLIFFGFIIAARYDSISDLLLPSIVFMIPSQLPALYYFGVSDSWLFYLLPTQPAMLLLAGAFKPLAAWQLVYSFVYLALLAVLMTWLARRAFDRFIVRNPGGG